MARKRVERQAKKSEPKTPHIQPHGRLHALMLARISAYTPALILLCLPTILLWSVTFGGKTLAPVDLLLVMSPWRHFAAERFPEFHSVKAPLLDVVQQYFPWRKFYAESLRQGELPLWNPFMFCGTSFVGNGMSAIFYPLNLLFVAMPIEAAFGWIAWVHLVLAGIFMFGFLRQFVSPIAALTGAIAFQLCGFFVAWLAYLPLICTAVWLPASLWAFEMGRGARDKGRGRQILSAMLAGFALGMALLAGHPQIGFYVLWAFAVYVFLRVVGDWGLGTGDWRQSLAFGLLTIFCGVAIGAPQLLPLMEMAKISFRSGTEALAMAATNRLPFDQFIRLFIPSFFGDWRSGIHLVWDFAQFNFVEKTGYPSVVAFLLAIVGAFSLLHKLCALHPAPVFRLGRNLAPRRIPRFPLRTSHSSFGSAGASPSEEFRTSHSAPRTSPSARQEPRPPNEPVHRPAPLVPFIAGIVFALIGLLAASVPIVHRFMALGLPGTQAFVGFSRALFLFDFGIAILAAFGIEFLTRQEPCPLKNSAPRTMHSAPGSARRELHPPNEPVHRPASFVPFVALVVALLFMAICVSHGVTVHAGTAFHPLLHDFTMSQIYRWLIFTALGTLSVFIALRSVPYASRITLYALPILVAADLLTFAWSQHPEADKEMAFFETPSIRWLKQNLGSQRFIAVGTDAVKHWTPSNTLMVYSLRDAQGSDSLMTMRIFRFLQSWDANSPLHRAFAVRNFDSPLLDLMAVKYVVAAEPLPADERKGLHLVHAGDLWIYENPGALPRAFVVSNWQWAKSPTEALKRIKSPDFDPQETTILEGARDAGRGTGKATSQKSRPSSPVPHPVRFTDRINTLRVEVGLSHPAALVVVDGTYPGWRVFGKRSAENGTRDGKWQELQEIIANYAFRAVLLPEGKWQVVWVYFPSSVIVGLFLCLTVVGMIFAVLTFMGKVKVSQKQQSGAGRI